MKETEKKKNKVDDDNNISDMKNNKENIKSSYIMNENDELEQNHLLFNLPDVEEETIMFQDKSEISSQYNEIMNIQEPIINTPSYHDNSIHNDASLLDNVNDMEQSYISSDYYDSSDISDDETNDDGYINCSFYLHKPVYIFDEEKDKEEMEQKMKNSNMKTSRKRNMFYYPRTNEEHNMNCNNSYIIKNNKKKTYNYSKNHFKKLKSVFKKLIKKIECDMNIKKRCYKLYDKNHKFLRRDYKCTKHKNEWVKFMNQYVNKKENTNDLFKGDNVLINSVYNQIYTYDNEVKNIIRIYKKQKMFLKNMKQKSFSNKYKNEYPWIGDNIFISPNNINKFILVIQK